MSKIYYHVVTDRKMKVGQELIFDYNHHSGVYNRVYELKDKVDDIYSSVSVFLEKILNG